MLEFFFANSNREVESQWRTTLSKAEHRLLSLIENAVFSCELDTALRTALRNRKEVVSMLATQPMTDLVEDIDTALSETAQEDEAAFMLLIDDKTGNNSCEEVGGSAPVVAELPTEVRMEICKAADSADDTRSKQLELLVAACWRQVDMYTVLMMETADSSAMCDRLKETAVNKLRTTPPQSEHANEKRYVLILYDLKSAGESSSHPATRPPPLRLNGEHLKTCLRAVIDALDSNAIGPKDMYLLFDGGRPGIVH